MHALRREVLLAPAWSIRSILPEEQYAALIDVCGLDAIERAGREVVLAIIDELWSDYLANIAELRGGIHWISWSGGDPLYRFLTGVQEIYSSFHDCLNEEVAAAFATAVIQNGAVEFQNRQRFDRGATWTYVTTDQPFGTMTERIMKGLRQRLSKIVRR